MTLPLLSLGTERAMKVGAAEVRKVLESKLSPIKNKLPFEIACHEHLLPEVSIDVGIERYELNEAIQKTFSKLTGRELEILSFSFL
jgi:hypothetical protein